MLEQSIPFKLQEAINLYVKAAEALPTPNTKLVIFLVIALFFSASGFIIYAIAKNKGGAFGFGLVAVICLGILGYQAYTNLMSPGYKSAKADFDKQEALVIQRMSNYVKDLPTKRIEVKEIEYYKKKLPYQLKNCENIYQEESMEDKPAVRLQLDDKYYSEACGHVKIRQELKPGKKPYVTFKTLPSELQIVGYDKYNGLTLFVPSNYEFKKPD